MFNLLFVSLFGWTLADAFRRGTRESLWLNWPLALLVVPAWLTSSFGAFNLDLRTAVALAVLIAFVVAPPKENPPFRLLLSDALILLLCVWISLSQFYSGRFGPLTVPEILRKWLLPYLMGRWFLRSSDDMGRVLPVIAKLCVIVSCLAVAEALLKFNIVNKVLNKTFPLLEEGEGYRWGLKRAQGNLDHPIFFGMMLVMIFPWAVEGFRRARKGQGPRWWRWLPFLLGGALFATASRGPQISAIFTFAATVFFRRPRWRLPIIAVGLVGALGAYAAKDQVVDALAAVAGEKGGEPIIITVDGEEVEYTGTNHRILLFQVYRDTFAKLGPFGYGAEMRGIDLEEDIAQRFGSIDNHYILFMLQHGRTAIWAFVALAACTIFNLARAAWDPGPQHAGLSGSLCGAMAAVAVMLSSVWFSPDFGTVWLFCAGLASNLACLPRTVPTETTETPATETPTPVVRRPRLFPGYAPRRDVS